MREILFHGKREYDGKWAVGSLIQAEKYCCILESEEELHPMDYPYLNGELGTFDGHATPIIPETVGQYTGMKEFVVSDRTYNKPLFEGDIVEVWGWRSPKYTYDAKSQHDGKIKVRATICFRHGEWTLDYVNKYNQSLAQLKGKEVDDREVTCEWSLYRYQRHNGNEDWYREHNANFKWSDIVKLGNVHDNADLLEG